MKMIKWADRDQGCTDQKETWQDRTPVSGISALRKHIK